jgi:hypothetical protein
MAKPKDWSDGTYFAIGGIVGMLAGAVGLNVLISISFPLHLLLAAACGLVFGGLAVALREDIIFFLP